MTGLDPAMIERAAEAIQSIVRLYHKDIAWEAMAGAADAAAGVIVPATAEAIAAAIEEVDTAADPAGRCYDAFRGRGNIDAAVARSFAAGLSAGATTGGDDG